MLASPRHGLYMTVNAMGKYSHHIRSYHSPQFFGASITMDTQLYLWFRLTPTATQPITGHFLYNGKYHLGKKLKITESNAKRDMH